MADRMTVSRTNLQVQSGPEFMVAWNLNSLCNFRCQYCFCSVESLAKEHPAVGRRSPQQVAACFDATGRIWRIHMSGGEPFLYPDFVGLCEALTQRHYISINTNLSTRNIAEFAERVPAARVLTVNAGLHIGERQRRTSGVERFLKRFLVLQDRGFNIRVEYVVHPPLLGRVERDVAFLRSEGVRAVNLKLFRGSYEGKSYPDAYSESEKALLREIALDVRELEILEGNYEFRGRLCAAGHRSFNMDQSGNLFRCLTIKKRHGNLFEETARFDASPRVCTARVCRCPYEGMQLVEDRRASKPALLAECLRQRLLGGSR